MDSKKQLMINDSSDATPGFGLEVCANSFSSALAAQEGGAIRVEFCENMAEGGTTPSYGQIKLAKERLEIEVWPIIRPRGGDFLYSDDEFQIMKLDIEFCKSLGCDGIVIGMLTSNGEIDRERCAKLVELAKPLPVAFHRAFDMCNDLSVGLEQLIELGIVRILTSGGAENAFKGAPLISALIKQAANRIEIMPGAGINPQNIQEIRNITGARVFHSSARAKVESKMKFRNQLSKMGNIEDEYQYEQTSATIVKELVNSLNTI